MRNISYDEYLKYLSLYKKEKFNQSEIDFLKLKSEKAFRARDIFIDNSFISIDISNYDILVTKLEDYWYLIRVVSFNNDDEFLIIDDFEELKNFTLKILSKII